MNKRYHFPKPFPLASQHRLRKRQRSYVGQGVPKEKSLYFYWYMYLRKSKKYQLACSNDGKGMKVIYRDFGDVFSLSFWQWWFEVDDSGIERGVRLFAIAEEAPARIVDTNKMGSKAHRLESDDFLTIQVSKSARASVILAEISRILAENLKSPPHLKKRKPRYNAFSTKVDVTSLAKALKAYEMKEENKPPVSIGAVAQGLNEKRDKEFFDIYEIDHRSMGTFKATDGFAPRDIFGRKIKHISDSMTDLRSRQRPTSIHAFYEPERKAYLISHAHRLIQKAISNIKGVEQGLFPLPHGKKRN